ncbi:IS630 family transposase [Halomicroarcula sp. GCM10025709]|uniref:IS630 family transposase n=1 Tax=Haloarcula TaxID=2237 RepID=UPI0024C335C6|nr:IS630 family transposase [Halomicroarcula sp. YJ-61-S]
MYGSRRFEVVEHLLNAELDQAIDDAQKADETHLVRRLCFVKNLYEGKTQQQAGAAVGVSQPTSSRWARAWNQNGIEGLRPRFGGGRPPKLTPAQWDEFCAVLEEGQPWTPREIHTLIEHHYGVTYHPTHLARKLRASGMHYAKPRPMDPRSPDDAEAILAERLSEAFGEDTDEDEKEDEDPVVLGFFR